jgi:hypothetical protein
VTEPVSPALPDPVQRRNFLRGGALLAGATAGAVAISAASALPAAAANGDAVTVGNAFTGSRTTTLTVSGSTAPTTPTLTLANATGPALALSPVSDDWDGSLHIGEIASTELGPYVGVEDDQGNGTAAFLATEFDLATVPSPMAFPTDRRLDTRYASGRTNILATSAGAFDSAHRLKAGAWVDVSIATNADDFVLDGAFLNLTSTGSTANGYLFAYPPGPDPRPVGSTTSYTKAVTTANSCFAAIDVIGTAYAVRIFTSAPSHVIVDLTGWVVSAGIGPAAPASATKSPRANRRSAARRVQHSLRTSRR